MFNYLPKNNTSAKDSNPTRPQVAGRGYAGSWILSSGYLRYRVLR